MAVDVAAFRKDLIHRTQAPCAEVLQSLEFLGSFDKRHERVRARAGSVGWAALISGGILLIFTAHAADVLPEHTLLMLLAVGAALLLVGGVAHLVRHARKSLDLENRRYELATRLVELLQADMSPSEPVTLTLDLRPETHDAKFQGYGETGTGWQMKQYVDPWLSLQARLLDGTYVQLEMTERIDMRKRTRSNSRGKYKTKNKRVSDALARVQLRVKPEKHPNLTRLGAKAREAVQLPEGAWLKGLSVEVDRLDLTMRVDAPWNAEGDTGGGELDATQAMAMAMLSLYQVLHLSRALDKKAAHPNAG